MDFKDGNDASVMSAGEVRFSITGRDVLSRARTGILVTSHGRVSTPAFMPVGTAAVVKTLSPADLRSAGVELLLGNTYHIHQRPGEETVALLGGLARFMSWDGPTLTDSGGFQVFSLSATRKVEEAGVVFQSVYDGRTLSLTPEKACTIQLRIGADVIYALDECPPYPSNHSEVERAADLSNRWARRFFDEFSRLDGMAKGVAAFPVVQGGVYEDVRRSAAEKLEALNPVGFGIGGVSVGEPPEEMIRIADICCAGLPDAKPRHLLGVGTPEDILSAIAVGVDLFDCVLPTRNGRNGQAFTSKGLVNIRLLEWKRTQEPLDPTCNCPVCRKYTKAYIHHLIVSGESLGRWMMSLHNISYYQALMREARDAIARGIYVQWSRDIRQGWRNSC